VQVHQELPFDCAQFATGLLNDAAMMSSKRHWSFLQDSAKSTVQLLLSITSFHAKKTFDSGSCGDDSLQISDSNLIHALDVPQIIM